VDERRGFPVVPLRLLLGCQSVDRAAFDSVKNFWGER
jgi:hypothetical protein